MRIKAAGLVSARALCLALARRDGAASAQAFRLGALITRARAPSRSRSRTRARPGSTRPWSARCREPAVAGQRAVDGAALRLAEREKRDADATPSCPSSTRRSPTRCTRRRAPRSRTCSAAVSQRAAAWAETRAPFARWTAAHYARRADRRAPARRSPGAALRRSTLHRVEIKFQAPHAIDATLSLIQVPDGTPRAPQALKALAIFLRAGVIRAAAALSKVSAARPRPRGRTPLVRKARRSLLPGLLDDVAAALPPTPAPPAKASAARCRRLAENTARASWPTATRSAAPSTWRRSRPTSVSVHAFGTRPPLSLAFPCLPAFMLCNLVTPRSVASMASRGDRRVLVPRTRARWILTGGETGRARYVRKELLCRGSLHISTAPRPILSARYSSRCWPQDSCGSRGDVRRRRRRAATTRSPTPTTARYPTARARRRGQRREHRRRRRPHEGLPPTPCARGQPGGALLGYSWPYRLERAMPRAEFDDFGRLCAAAPLVQRRHGLQFGGSLPQRLR